MLETRFESLDSLKLDTSLRLQMWSSLKDWKQLTGGWINGKFIDINIGLIKDKSDVYSKVISKC